MVGSTRASSLLRVVIWEEAELLWRCGCSCDQFEEAGLAPLLFSAVESFLGATGNGFLSPWIDLSTCCLRNGPTKFEQLNVARSSYEQPPRSRPVRQQDPFIPKAHAKNETATSFFLRKRFTTYDGPDDFRDDMNTSVTLKACPCINRRRSLLDNFDTPFETPEFDDSLNIITP